MGLLGGLLALPTLALIVIVTVSVISTFTGRGTSTNFEISATLFVSCLLIPIVIGSVCLLASRQTRGRSFRVVGFTWLALVLIASVTVSVASSIAGPDQTEESDFVLTEVTNTPEVLLLTSTDESDATSTPIIMPTNAVAVTPNQTSTPIETRAFTRTPLPTRTSVATDTTAFPVTSGPTPLTECQGDQDGEGSSIFSVLEVLKVEYVDGAVHITGCTDLPDDAVLDVSFDISNYMPDDSYVGIETQVQVEEGLFEATLVPPNIPQYQQGLYLVEVWFRANETQTAEVLDLVGEGGEHLAGERVWQLETGDKTLLADTTIPLTLEIVLPTYPQVDPSVFEEDTPERAMAEYLLAWQNEDWETMASWTQATWREGADNPPIDLMHWVGFKKLLGAEINPTQPIEASEVSTQLSVTLYYALNPTWIKKVSVQPFLVREDEAYSPSILGDWGVNPISMLDETELDGSTSTIATATPSLDPTADLNANIIDIDTSSYGNVERYEIYVNLPFPVSEDAIVELCQWVVEDFKRDNSFNAVAVYISDLDAHYFGYTIARCDYAPNGEWNDAGNVSAGDYSQHEYSYEFRSKVREPGLAIEEMPSDQEAELCNDWMVTIESLDEAGFYPGAESENEADRLIAEKYGMQASKVEDTVLKCVFWTFR